MNEKFLEMIEKELAILIRRNQSLTYKKVGYLERSAYLLLYQIDSQGPAGVKALAGEFKLDLSTVSRQAAALEQKGYVYKIPDPTDGRAYSFQITELGKKVLMENKQLRVQKIAEITSSWSDTERELFGGLLYKYNKSVLDTINEDE